MYSNFIFVRSGDNVHVKSMDYVQFIHRGVMHSLYVQVQGEISSSSSKLLLYVTFRHKWSFK